MIPMANLERRTVSADIYMGREEQIQTLETDSSSLLSSFCCDSNSFNSSSDRDQSEDLTQKEFNTYDERAMYRSVSTGNIHLNME